MELQFTDQKIVLNDQLTELKAAEDFESVKKARLAELRAESLSIINSQQLTSTTPSTHVNTSSTSRVMQNQDLSNVINATSLEDNDSYSGEASNTINRWVRQRRAIFDFDVTATASASTLPNWMSITRIIATHIRETSGEIFSMLQNHIGNLTTYLASAQVSAPDSLQQTLLGNKPLLLIVIPFKQVKLIRAYLYNRVFQYP
ncbi:MAG: hypothetical protein E6K54_06940 [Gammaproteobacteria bacterium]|nr:MAG: hypothetical protein E6K54_06940 [Gammaproteobacteria bacterium]